MNAATTTVSTPTAPPQPGVLTAGPQGGTGRLGRAQWPAHPPLTKHDALERIRSGVSVAQIARDLGLHRSTIDNWKREAGLQRRTGGGHSEPVRTAAVDQVRQGASPTQVAGQFGVTPATILAWCGHAGVHAKGAKHAEDVRSEALRLVAVLGTAAAAAAELELPAATVVTWCSAAAVPLEQSSLNTRRVRALEAEVVELLDSMPGAAIARAMSISADAVAAIAARHNKKLIGVQPAPIQIRALAELDRRAGEVLALGADSPRVADAKRTHGQSYLAWCEAQKLVPTAEESFAAFLLAKLRRGTSGRPGDRGQPTGCTAGTIGTWRSHIAELLANMGHPHAADWPAVQRAMARVKREAPVGGEGRRRLTPEEIQRMANVPPPRPSTDVLVARVAIALCAAGSMGLAGAVRAACAGPQTATDATAPAAFLRVRAGAGIVLQHGPGGTIGCGHCAAEELTRRGTWPGTGAAAESARTRVSRRLRRACADGHIDPGAPWTSRQAERLAWLVDLGLVRWARSHAYAALLRTVGGRGDEILKLLIGDLSEPEDGLHKARTRRRKNDQFGRGQTTGLAGRELRGTMARLELWLFLLGPDLPDDHPLFPGPSGNPLHRGSGGAALRSLFDAAGVDGLAGSHSFRRTLISELLERGVFLSRVARRVGITAQTAFGYYEALSAADDTAEQLGLAE